MTQEDLGIDLSGIYTGNLKHITTDELDTIVEIFKYAMLNEGVALHEINGEYISDVLEEIL